jgi:hypothetical protein
MEEEIKRKSKISKTRLEMNLFRKCNAGGF